MNLPNYLFACWAFLASRLRLVYLLVFFGLLTGSSAFSQCENTIKVEKVSSDETGTKGIIEVAINTSKEYSCVLKIQKGSGSEFVQQKKGSGSGTVQFTHLDKNAIYQVEVEFVSEEKVICKKLQKSLITFE